MNGWSGDRCESDRNECRDESALCQQYSHCVNTVGSFKCLCNNGFSDTANGGCQELPLYHKVSAIITLDYNISNIDFGDQTSQNYKRLAETVQNGLLESLKKVEPSVISLKITKLSKGSLIGESEITMGTKNNTGKESEVDLNKALVQMMQDRNVIMINSTPVIMSNLTINGEEFLKSDGPCDIQSKIEPCSSFDICEEVGKEAVCKHRVEKDSQKLIIGLSVGLSLFMILFVSIWIIFCYWVKQNKVKNKVENNETMELFKSQAPREHILPKHLRTDTDDNQSQGTHNYADGVSWQNSVLANKSSNAKISRPHILVSGSTNNSAINTKYRGHQMSADMDLSVNEMMTSNNL